MRLDEKPSVLFMGHPLLFQKQKAVSPTEIQTDEFQHNLEIMKKSQFRENGIGIAAPQIGWPVRVLCMGIAEQNRERYEKSPDIPFQFWINPRIKAVSPTTSWTWEGCLSVPGLRGWVERPSHIDVEGLNEKGELVQLRLSDYMARVFQHELDHLNGILFPMRVSDISLLVPLESMSFQSEWAKDWPTPNARKSPPGMLSPAR